MSGFVRQLGYRIVAATWRDNPDAILTLRKAGRDCKVAIEHTEYCNDTVAGTASPRSAIQDFWTDVSNSLVRRICQRPSLRAVAGICTLRTNMWPLRPAPRQTLASRFACEFVQLLEQNPLGNSHSRKLWGNDFEDFPTLKAHCDSITAKRWRDWHGIVTTRTWTCQNLTAGNVGFSTEYLVSAIVAKTRKAQRYDWDGASEKWLLIAASARNPSHHVGPKHVFYQWDDPCLRCACMQSPFDQIYLWDVGRSWHEQLKRSSKGN